MPPLITIFAFAAFLVAIVMIQRLASVVARLRRDLSENANELDVRQNQNRELLQNNGVLQRKAEALQKELDGASLELTEANSRIAGEEDQNRRLLHEKGVLQRKAEALQKELDGTTLGLTEANRRIAVYRTMKQELVVAEWHWKYHESMNDYWHSEAVRFRSRADKLSQAASEERSKELKRKLVEGALTHGVALAV